MLLPRPAVAECSDARQLSDWQSSSEVKVWIVSEKVSCYVLWVFDVSIKSTDWYQCTIIMRCTVGLQHQRQHQHQRATMSKCAAQRLVIADANRTLEVAICNDKRRQRHLYTSAGNDVTVFVKYSSRYVAFAPNSPATFILHYQGMTCVC